MPPSDRIATTKGQLWRVPATPHPPQLHYRAQTAAMPYVRNVPQNEFVYTRSDDPRARPLIDELSREYDERYGLNDGIPSSVELSRYPAERFSPENGGAFLLVVRDDQVVAGGAFMRTDDTTAEIKRVWTSSAHRRQGLARVVMAELEREAAARGYTVAELTTGARQPEAVALYLSLGYTPQFDLDGDLEAIGYLAFTKPLSS